MLKRVYYSFFFALLILTSCQKKPVQLPLIDIPGVTEIQNHSSIWIFMVSQDGENIAELNKNNKIINTDWIFNIDRRLTMHQIIPILIDMQKNKNKDSMHKKEGMKNYFSYADTASEKISLTSFPQTNFILGSKETLKMTEEPCNVYLEIWGKELKINGTITTINAVLSFLQNELVCPPEENSKIFLCYEDSTNYQDYLYMKTLLLSKQINCASDEYVYTVK